VDEERIKPTGDLPQLRSVHRVAFSGSTLLAGYKGSLSRQFTWKSVVVTEVVVQNVEAYMIHVT